jgi:hypothetical protein
VLKRLRQAIFITFGYGIPAVWVMFQFAGPLTSEMLGIMTTISEWAINAGNEPIVIATPYISCGDKRH